MYVYAKGTISISILFHVYFHHLPEIVLVSVLVYVEKYNICSFITTDPLSGTCIIRQTEYFRVQKTEEQQIVQQFATRSKSCVLAVSHTSTRVTVLFHDF